MAYGAQFGGGQGLRPHIRIEMSFRAPALAPVARPIRSLIAAAQREPPEIASFPCVDPVETAADKLSALAWRVRCARSRRDPTTIRPSSVICTISPRSKRQVASAPRFAELVLAAAAADVGRGGERTAPADPAAMFADMLRRLETDPLWAREYEDFVRAVSFAGPGEQIDFSAALEACRRLVSDCGFESQISGSR